MCAALNQTAEACERAGNAEPNGHSTGVTGRTYQFPTKSGAYLAECKREYTFTVHGKLGAFLGQHFPGLMCWLQRDKRS